MNLMLRETGTDKFECILATPRSTLQLSATTHTHTHTHCLASPSELHRMDGILHTLAHCFLEGYLEVPGVLLTEHKLPVLLRSRTTATSLHIIVSIYIYIYIYCIFYAI